MLREIFRIGPLSISPFGLMMVVAFFAAYLQLRRNLMRLEIGDDEDASAILLAGALGGILGAKIYYAILYQDWRLLFERYGLVWYGGFVLATLAILWTMRRRRLPPWLTADATAPALPLGYALGRVGCFLSELCAPFNFAEHSEDCPLADQEDVQQVVVVCGAGEFGGDAEFTKAPIHLPCHHCNHAKWTVQPRVVG